MRIEDNCFYVLHYGTKYMLGYVLGFSVPQTSFERALIEGKVSTHDLNYFTRIFGSYSKFYRNFHRQRAGLEELKVLTTKYEENEKDVTFKRKANYKNKRHYLMDKSTESKYFTALICNEIKVDKKTFYKPVVLPRDTFEFYHKDVMNLYMYTVFTAHSLEEVMKYYRVHDLLTEKIERLSALEPQYIDYFRYLEKPKKEDSSAWIVKNQLLNQSLRSKNLNVLTSDEVYI